MNWLCCRHPFSFLRPKRGRVCVRECVLCVRLCFVRVCVPHSINVICAPDLQCPHKGRLRKKMWLLSHHTHTLCMMQLAG